MTAIVDAPREQPVLARNGKVETTNRRARRRERQKSLAAMRKPVRKDSDGDESGRTAPLNSDFFESSDETGVLKSCLKRVSSSSSLSSTVPKSVSFDRIQVAEHHVILGDNPSVSSGPPLTIAWESQAFYVYSVEEYEQSRPDTCKDEDDLLVTRKIREDWLRSAGTSRSEMASALRSVQKVKRDRAATAAQQNSFIVKLLKRKTK